MPLSPAFRKDIGDVKKIVLTDRNYPAAVTLIETLLAQHNQNPKYTEKEVGLLQHALAHLKDLAAFPETAYPEVLERIRDRILDRDPDTT